MPWDSNPWLQEGSQRSNHGAMSVIFITRRFTSDIIKNDFWKTFTEQVITRYFGRWPQTKIGH